jgi:DNA-binding transcriptional LysR family regulator
VNLRFVEAFYWVATLKSVSRAAERMHVTQSAISARLIALEDELGVLLLDRRDKRVRLTVAGSRFVGYAQRLMELQRTAISQLGAPQDQPVGLRIGAIESVLHSWLMPWIEDLRRKQLGLELELTVETTPVLMDQMQRGALDIAFAAMPAPGEGIRIKSLQALSMGFVGQSARYPKRKYSLAQIAQDDLLTFQRGSQPYVGLMDTLRGQGVAPRKVHAISSISAMVQLVQGGFGVATLPHAAAQPLLAQRELKMLNCDVQLPPLPIFASYRDNPVNGLVDDVIAQAVYWAAR